MILSEVSVRRPVFAAVISLLLVVFGILAWLNLPLREYPDCLYHERFFNAYEVLREAYGSKFAKPTGVEMTLTVSAAHAEDLAIFDKSLAPSMVRLLASGLGDDALMHRLYEDQIKGTSFPEASGIVWQLKQTANNGLNRQFSLVGSQFWLASFEHTQSFDGVSHADSAG